MPEARIAPITDTPIVPPMVRKNWAALVAAPRWRLGTPFCTTSDEVLDQQAEPEAGDDHRHGGVHARPEPASSVESSRKPAPMTTGPAISAQR